MTDSKMKRMNRNNKIYLLSNQKYNDVINLNIFDIHYLDLKVDLRKFDSLIFTSQNAVKAINKSNEYWKNLSSYCISKKTANEVIKLNGKLEFVGSSNSGNEFANELINILKNKKVLYIRALKVVSNLVDILKINNIDITELVAYKTFCKKLNVCLDDHSIFIFTSPSCVNCFFSQYEWKETFKAVVIGETTAKFIPSNVNYVVSNISSIENCIKIAKTLF